MRVTVYTKTETYCPQCVTTERALKKEGVPFDVVAGIDTPEHAETLAAFKARPVPLLSAPIVTVHDADGNELDAWAGFLPDKIKALA